MGTTTKTSSSSSSSSFWLPALITASDNYDRLMRELNANDKPACHGDMCRTSRANRAREGEGEGECRPPQSSLQHCSWYQTTSTTMAAHTHPYPHAERGRSRSQAEWKFNEGDTCTPLICLQITSDALHARAHVPWRAQGGVASQRLIAFGSHAP